MEKFFINLSKGQIQLVKCRSIHSTARWVSPTAFSNHAQINLWCSQHEEISGSDPLFLVIIQICNNLGGFRGGATFQNEFIHVVVRLLDGRWRSTIYWHTLTLLGYPRSLEKGIPSVFWLDCRWGLSTPSRA